MTGREASEKTCFVSYDDTQFNPPGSVFARQILGTWKRYDLVEETARPSGLDIIKKASVFEAAQHSAFITARSWTTFWTCLQLLTNSESPACCLLSTPNEASRRAE